MNEQDKLFYLSCLEQGTNQINSLSTWKELKIQLEENLEYTKKVQAILIENSTFSAKLSNNTNLNIIVNYLLNISPYINNFIHKDFEAAFFPVWNLVKEIEDKSGKALFSNLAIDALGQVKTQYIEDNRYADYYLYFNDIEKQLITVCEDVSNISKIEADKTTKLLVNYHAYNIGIAYLKFLDQDLEATHHYLQKQCLIFDKEIVILNETQSKTPIWFYDTINQKHKTEFQQFLFDSINPKNKLKTKI